MSGSGAAGTAGTAEGDLDERTRALVRLSATLAVGPALQPEAMDEAAAVAPEEAEEVLLQSYLFLGYPVALNALGLWRRRTGRPAASGAETPTDPASASVGREAGELEEWADRGVEVCRAVYGHQYRALREVMAGVHPELDRWAVTEGYGKVLGRPELDLVTRELCIAALLAGTDATRQLHAHLRGCLNVGAAPGVVAAVLDAVAPLVGPERADSARAVWQRVRERWLAKEGRD